LVCPRFRLPPWGVAYGLFVTLIPAPLSGLMTLVAHVPCLHCFHVAYTISFLFPSLFVLYSLSPFSFCLAPSAQTLISSFASAQYFLLQWHTYLSFPACPRYLLCVNKLSFVSAQYLYCSGVRSFFACIWFPIPPGRQ
jgi:hypothetical protein